MICGSTETTTGKPCQRTVKNKYETCFQHPHQRESESILDQFPKRSMTVIEDWNVSDSGIPFKTCCNELERVVKSWVEATGLDISSFPLDENDETLHSEGCEFLEIRDRVYNHYPHEEDRNWLAFIRLPFLGFETFESEFLTEPIRSDIDEILPSRTYPTGLRVWKKETPPHRQNLESEEYVKENTFYPYRPDKLSLWERIKQFFKRLF